eukprot:4844786-Pyramimonas_sp.AAC.1
MCNTLPSTIGVRLNACASPSQTRLPARAATTSASMPCSSGPAGLYRASTCTHTRRRHIHLLPKPSAESYFRSVGACQGQSRFATLVCCGVDAKRIEGYSHTAIHISYTHLSLTADKKLRVIPFYLVVKWLLFKEGVHGIHFLKGCGIRLRWQQQRLLVLQAPGRATHMLVHVKQHDSTHISSQRKT